MRAIIGNSIVFFENLPATCVAYAVEPKDTFFEVGNLIGFEEVDCAFDFGFLRGHVVFEAHCCPNLPYKLAVQDGLLMVECREIPSDDGGVGGAAKKTGFL